MEPKWKERKGRRGMKGREKKCRVPSSPGRKRRHRWFMVARPYYGRRDRGVRMCIATKKGEKRVLFFSRTHQEASDTKGELHCQVRLRSVGAQRWGSGAKGREEKGLLDRSVGRWV